MNDPLELGLGGFIGAVADPDDPIASSVLAAQVVATAAALLTMASRASSSPDGLGLAAQGESVRARCETLVGRCAQAFGEASQRLRARSSPGDAGAELDFLLGRALYRAAEGPAAVAETAGDVSLLALAVAEVCEQEQLPDVRAATLFADAAATACVGLVVVNLVAGSDEELLAQARRGAELSGEARRKLLADVP